MYVSSVRVRSICVDERTNEIDLDEIGSRR